MDARMIHGDGRAVRLAVWALAAAVLSSAPGTVGAAERVALVIGNGAYEHVATLKNPGNDAADMAAALGRLGFEVVEGTNLDLDGFYDKLGEFDEAARGADVTLFFYSGHGLDVEGRNWLVATDARLEKKPDLRRGAIGLDAVLESMRGTKKLVFLDASRTNPLPGDWARSSMGPPWAVSGSGMLFVYATAPGVEAADGAGRNSPFTAALLAHIETPGLSVLDVFSEVAASVREATNGDQQPWMVSSLLAPVYLASGARRNRLGPPGTTFRDCPECPEMVVVPSGSFMMGSPSGETGRFYDEEPVHRVTIERPFAVGVKEVTRGEFARFVSATGHSMGDSCIQGAVNLGTLLLYRKDRHWRNPGFSQTDEHPVVCVNRNDAQAYVEWLSQETGQKYRLPSESEWEYVARAGTGTARYWGESEAGQGRCRHANGRHRSKWWNGSAWIEMPVYCDDGHDWTSPVGSYEANGFGLRDVMGNVWEWVEDCWNESYHGAPADGSAWESGDCSDRVLRGGSWDNKFWFLRSANRVRNPSDIRYYDAGFRVVVEDFSGNTCTKCAQTQIDKLEEPGKPLVAAGGDPEDEAPPVAISTVPSPEAEARRKRVGPPGTKFRDCPECPEMVVVPSGSFMMGAPESEASEDLVDAEVPVHRVTIARSFAVGVYEVTLEEWDACASGGGCGGHRLSDRGRGRGRFPVIGMSEAAAQAYVEWLSRKTGEEYRLLSESEWEYVARAGTGTRYWWGDEIGRNRANCRGCGSRWDARRTAPVGSFSANLFGLYDVHGNVKELVEDCWHYDYRGAPHDGSVWTRESRRWGSLDCIHWVVRGGSWENWPERLRSAYRIRYSPESRVYIPSVGLRVARTLTPPPPGEAADAELNIRPGDLSRRMENIDTFLHLSP